jgi:lysyl-tRNA synthetase class II
MAEQKTNQQPEQDLSQQSKVRREKLSALQAEGRDPFQITRFDWMRKFTSSSRSTTSATSWAWTARYSAPSGAR